MSAPVDLTNLRSMTDGDKEMEQALFEEFFSCFETGIATLQASLAEEASETWRREAHALKGVALNLGANQLGELCKKGQESHLSPQAAKLEIVTQIDSEYHQVKSFLNALT